MHMKYTGLIVVLLLTTTLLACCCFAQNVRQNGHSTNQQTNDKLQKTKESASNETCGSFDDLALKVERCAQPLMEIIEGTIDPWPSTEDDIAKLCESYSGSERCIRDVGRKCAKGLHKTIISTLANSIQRVRKRECAKPKYPSYLKMSQCLERNQIGLRSLIANSTSRLYVIQKQLPIEKKTNGLCCMMLEIENDLIKLLNPKCPAESIDLNRLYRAVLQDVLDLICRSPKCEDDIFRGYKIVQVTNIGGIISLLLKILFSLT